MKIAKCLNLVLSVYSVEFNYVRPYGLQQYFVVKYSSLYTIHIVNEINATLVIKFIAC